MADAATATYPLIRGRRRGERRRRRWWRTLSALVTIRRLRLAAIALLALGVVAGGVAAVRRANAPDPGVELAAALDAIDRGNYSAARNHAQAATQARPGWGIAHAILARAYLLLGDGVPAEGEIARATEAGFPAARTYQLLAHAAWLQGDSARAIATAARAPRRYSGYAARIRARALADQGDYPAALAALEQAVAADPANAAAWTDLARVRYRAGDLAGASAAVAHATAIRPVDPDALTLTGELVRARYGLAGALPWFRAALARDAFFHPALIEYAATLGDLGRYTDMLAASRRALVARPGSAQALYLQAVLAARAGHYDLARSLLARTGGVIDDMPGVLLLGGSLDQAAGKPQAAIGAWGELVGRQPMNLVARRLLGAAQLAAGDAKGTLDTLRPIGLRADADAYTLTLIGRAFETTGERGWAARFLDRAARSGAAEAAPFGNDDSLPVLAAAAAEAPGKPAAAIEYVRGLIEAGQTGVALDRARAMAAASPGAPAAQAMVGDILMTTGRPGEALAAYARAANLDFGAPALLRLVEAAAQAGRPRAAANALALYLGQNPTSLVARRVAANLQLAARDWTAAIDSLEALRQAMGDRDAVVLAQLAIAYAGAGDAPTAVRYARAGYALAPMDAGVADAYGWALYQSGDVAGGLQLAAKAAILSPANSTVRWHLAQLLAEAGRTAEARAAIDAALADPGFADRAAAQALRAGL